VDCEAALKGRDKIAAATLISPLQGWRVTWWLPSPLGWAIGWRAVGAFFSSLRSCRSAGDERQESSPPWRAPKCASASSTPHSTLHTPHSTLHNPQSTFSNPLPFPSHPSKPTPRLNPPSTIYHTIYHHPSPHSATNSSTSSSPKQNPCAASFFPAAVMRRRCGPSAKSCSPKSSAPDGQTRPA
jgi:hypothetical protein